jgi:putative flippase GtrA
MNVGLGQGVLATAYALGHMSAVTSNLIATAVATGPAYWLSKHWVWRGRGRYHLAWEVIPFWSLAFLGLVLSTLMAAAAGRLARSITSDRLEQTVVVMLGTLIAYGVIWILRFFVLDRGLFPASHAKGLVQEEPTTADH